VAGHSFEKQIGLIKASIESFGQIKPVVIDDNHTILAGHGFVQAAQPAGLAQVSVIRFSHLTETQKRATSRASSRAREVPEAIDELDPLRGSLIHDIRFELFERLRVRNLLPVRPKNLGQVKQILDVVIEEAAGRYYDDLAPAIDRIWHDGIAAIRADLREWLRRASEDQSGYIPWHFEMSFGLEHRNERRTATHNRCRVPLNWTAAFSCAVRSISLNAIHPALCE